MITGLFPVFCMYLTGKENFLRVLNTLRQLLLEVQKPCNLAELYQQRHWGKHLEHIFQKLILNILVQLHKKKYQSLLFEKQFQRRNTADLETFLLFLNTES